MSLPATYRRERVQRVIEAVEEHAKWIQSVPESVLTREFRMGALVGMRYVLSVMKHELGTQYDDSLFETEEEAEKL